MARTDGQKGMGLISARCSIGIVPATYALDMRSSPEAVRKAVAAAKVLETELSAPDLASMMEALRDQHMATARVERMTRGQGVAAAETLEYEIVNDVFKALASDDPVLATLDPLPLTRG